MKKLFVLSTLLLLSLSLIMVLEARGGRGGGGGGRGGGGRSVQRGPSMSRASRPAPATRPRESRADISRANRTNSPASRVAREGRSRNEVEQFMRNRPVQRSTELSDRPRLNDNRGQQLRDNREFENIGRNVRSDINSKYRNRSTWFNRNFWDNHHYRPPYYGNSANWWRGATAVGIGSWLGWRNQPYYYSDYDDFGYSGGYYGAQEDAYSQPSYSQQYQAIESSGTDTNNQWMPLGVFSVTKNSATSASPNMFVQLALNKTGGISGTFYNTTTDKAYELEGWVDPESQRAAWKIANNEQSPIIETGIYNLTQDEAPVRIHFPNGTSQDRLLVKVEGF